MCSSISATAFSTGAGIFSSFGFNLWQRGAGVNNEVEKQRRRRAGAKTEERRRGTRTKECTKVVDGQLRKAEVVLRMTGKKIGDAKTHDAPQKVTERLQQRTADRD
jgi:hypothetical protein